MAVYLLRKKALIQHIPRTGGTWIEDVIRELHIRTKPWLSQQIYGLPRHHSLLAHYYKNQHIRNIRFVYATVRHPKAFYESIWKSFMNARKFAREYRQHTKFNWSSRKAAAIVWNEVGREKSDFNDWVFVMLKRHPLWYTRIVESFVGPEGGEFVDYIGRTETIAQDLLNFLQIVGYDVDELPIISPSNTAKKKLLWSKNLLDDVLETESSVISRFYYSDKRLFHLLGKNVSRKPECCILKKKESLIVERVKEQTERDNKHVK